MAKMSDYEDSVDARFWTDNDMMDLDYHRGIKSSPIKIVFAKIMAGMMHGIFKKKRVKEL